MNTDGRLTALGVGTSILRVDGKTRAAGEEGPDGSLPAEPKKAEKARLGRPIMGTEFWKGKPIGDGTPLEAERS